MKTTRRSILSGISVLAACGTGASGPAEPPLQVHGGWTRIAMEEATAEALPATVRMLQPIKVWKVSYRGPQDIKGVWAQFANDTVAFEAFQKVSKGPSIRPFYRGRAFVVLDAEDTPQQALGDFQEGVSKSIH